jgi:hypothetical protein
MVRDVSWRYHRISSSTLPIELSSSGRMLMHGLTSFECCGWSRSNPESKVAVTADGTLSAHFEHSVAVTADGPLIPTKE